MSITNVCTKLQLKIPTDADMGGTVGIHGPACLQAKLGPPPVSPLGVVPEAGRKTRGLVIHELNHNLDGKKHDADPMVSHSFHKLA